MIRSQAFVILFLWRLRVDHRRILGILPYAGDALLTAVLLDIAFTGCDYLAVFGLQAESELAGLILIDLELGVLLLLKSRNSLVLKIGDRRILDNALDAIFDAGKSIIDLAAHCDHLAVSCFKTVGIAGLSCFNDEFSHDIQHLS